MLVRTILILACLLSSRALAQDAAPPPTVEPRAVPTPTPPPVPPVPPVTSPKTDESVQSAVPVDREALVPATEASPKRSIESDPMFTPAVVLIGTGGAALLASLFTGLGAHGIYNSLETACNNDICSPDKAQRIDSGKTLAMVSTVLTGAGIVAAGIGTTLLILAANREEKPPSQSAFGFAQLHITGGPTPLGIGAAGSF
jgi:hypothetical protein